MLKIVENFSLRGLNTFGIAASSRYYCEFGSVEELRGLLDYCKSNGLRWYVVGGGANIVFSGDFDGMIIRPSMCGIEYCGDGLVVAEAGVDWDSLVEWSVARGYGGLENLSYIPGSVGASPIQNIGAYGVEAKDSIEWVDCLDVATGDVRRISHRECGFGYRDSIFKRELRGRVVVLRVGFRLRENVESFNIEYGDVAAEVAKRGGASLRTIREAITSIRRSKLPEPSELGNAGSFFKNPVVSVAKFEELRDRFDDLKWFDVAGGAGKKIPAGWMIEKAGWKGRREGNVGVHERQALVLVNYGGANGEEILNFAKRVQNGVFEMFGVEIEMEVNVM